MDESIATATVDVGGRPYAVVDLPFRGERVGGLAAPARRARAGGVRADRRRDAPPDRHGAERPPPRGGRVQGARPCAAGRLRAGSAPRRRRLDEGFARVTARPLHRRRRLRRRQPGQHRPGADHGRRRRPDRPGRRAPSLAPTRSSCPASGPRRRPWPGSIATASPGRSARWLAAGRPFLGICLGLQLLFEGSDEDGATTLGVLPGRTRRLEDAPTLPHIGWNQVERTRDHPLFDGIDDGADFYFVHSYAGALQDDGRRPTSSLPGRHMAGRSPRPSSAARCSASSSTPSEADRTACGCSRNFVGLVRAAA